MYPLLNDLQSLSKSGIQLMCDGVQHDFYPFLVYCACDLPARAMIQNLKHPTGSSACPICLHTGHRNEEKSANSTRSFIRYRYGKEESSSALRTYEQTIEHAQKKLNGVKGFSCLMTLPYFDIIKNVTTDYMHGSILGVTKRILQIIIGDLKVSTTFKVLSKKHQIELNRRLTALKPYSSIKYKPRPLSELATFRAIELKNYLFFFI